MSTSADFDNFGLRAIVAGFDLKRIASLLLEPCHLGLKQGDLDKPDSKIIVALAATLEKWFTATPFLDRNFVFLVAVGAIGSDR
jgi:hypothetical protein